MQLFVILDSETQLSITSVSTIGDYFDLQESNNKIIEKYNLESYVDVEQLIYQLVTLVLQNNRGRASYEYLIENLINLFGVLRELPGTPQSETEYNNKINNIAEQVLDSIKQFSK